MNKNIVNILFVGLLMFLTTNLVAKKIEKLPEGVSIYQLDNGIEVLLIENPALPMIGINTVVKVGSAYESFFTSGMSHMLEHLLFNGTTTMTQRELYDLTDKIGGYNNANTSEYYTNFMMVTPVDKIKDGMKIQADMLFNSTLPREKFQKEKGIVLEEIAKSLGNSDEQIDRNIISSLYAGHTLSLPTLGTYQTIKNMDRDEVYAFYKNNYVPNNMRISVIGNFESSEMLKLINEIYGNAAPGNVVRSDIDSWATGFNLPRENNKKGISYKFHNGDKIHLQQFYQAGNHSSEFFELLDLSLSQKIGGVEEKLKEKFPQEIEGLNYSVRNNPIRSYVELDVILNDDNNLERISETLNNEIEKINFALPDETVKSEAIKAQTNFLKQIEKPHMFGIYNADIIAKAGFGAIISAFSGNGYYKTGVELSNFKINTFPQIIIQYPFEKGKKKGIAKTEPLLFENGITKSVVIAKQNSASNLLAIHYMFKYKGEYEREYGDGVAKKWHSAFGKRMKSPENRKLNSKYGLTFVVNDNPYIPMDNIYLSPSFGYIRVEGLANDIKGTIEYLNKEMLNFVPTEDEFNKVNKSGMPSMMGHKNKSKLMYEAAYDSLVLQPVPQKNKTKKLTYERFLQFGKEYFAPSNIIISVVSKEVPQTINKYFADFENKKITPKFSGNARLQDLRKWNEDKVIKKNGGGEQSYTFYGFVKNISKADEPALTILSRMLADDISFNIREKQGLAYRMSSGIKIVGDKALIYVSVPTQPNNVEKLVPQFEGLFNPEFADTKTKDDLEKTINMYLGKMMFRRLSSINQAYYLAYSYYFDGDITSDEKNLEAIKNVRLEDLKRVASKYLRAENSVKIVIH